MGNYTISEFEREGWFRISPATGSYIASVLSPGTILFPFDFGNTRSSSVSGTKFNDLNNNGTREGGDPGLPDWPFQLRLSVRDTTFTASTDSNGHFTFRNLPTGTFKLSEEFVPGWERTYPSESGEYFLTIDSSGTELYGYNFGNHKLTGGSVYGAKFNDLNKDGVRDAVEPGLSGWTIVLKPDRRSVNHVTEYSAITFTDDAGNYSFLGVPEGAYIVTEENQDGWYQTYPQSSTGNNFHPIDLKGDASVDSVDFGNALGCFFTHAVSGEFNNPLNWSCGHVPGGGDALIVHDDTLTITDIPGDSLSALEVDSGGVVHFDTDTVKISGTVHIDSSGTLDLGKGGTLICEDDWINEGNFESDSTTIIFEGDNEKFISWGTGNSPGGFSKRGKTASISGNTFFNLIINGITGTLGNVIVTNELQVNDSLKPQLEDTIDVERNTTTGLIGTSVVTQGSVRRTIASGETSTYRFHSVNASIRFEGDGTNPDAVLIRKEPATNSKALGLLWKPLGGTINTVSNYIEVPNIDQFSKWTLGRPGPGFGKTEGTDSLTTAGDIQRVYTIEPEGGSGFKATIRLDYDQSEFSGGVEEADLQVLRGPYVRRTVSDKWNMVSVPVKPRISTVTSLFPVALNNAYSFISGSGYSEQTSMSVDKGYWLKFSGTQTITIKGNDRTNAEIPVSAGWNLVGSISYPVKPSRVYSYPDDIITSSFYKYANGYTIADSLLPMRGYWVKVNTSGAIVLNLDSASFPKHSSLIGELDRLNSLHVTDGAGGTQTLNFGNANDINPEKYELPPVPPRGIFDARFTSGRMVELADQRTAKDIPIEIASAAYPISINWKIGEGQHGTSSLLIDGKEIAIRGNGSVSVASSKSSVVLHLNPVSGQLPKEFALEQNYPNPFNPTTSIRYALPVDAHVSVKIFNVLGQQVKTIVDAEQNAGEKTILWNGALENGVTAPSGIYFYRLDAASLIDPGKTFSQMRKMMLVK